MSGSPRVLRFVCNSCGHVHAAWQARCEICTKYGVSFATEVPASVQTAPDQKAAHQSAAQSAHQSAAQQEEIPRVPHLRIVRLPSPSPELSPEELMDDGDVDENVDAVVPPSSHGPIPITDIAETEHPRNSTGLAPLDHVLGGGLVVASAVLLAAPPGCGKSSLTLQMLKGLGHRCLYVTGEETLEQLAGTARRVDALTPLLLVLVETDVSTILAHARAARAQTIVIDSIQKMVCEDVNGRAGSPGQLKECTARLVKYAKDNYTALWIIGHVTGDGDIAGPKTIEHDVDVVLELSQGQKFDGNERILRCPTKNRFGATDANAVGYFQLTDRGFVPVDLDGWNEEL